MITRVPPCLLLGLLSITSNGQDADHEKVYVGDRLVQFVLSGYTLSSNIDKASIEAQYDSKYYQEGEYLTLGGGNSGYGANARCEVHFDRLQPSLSFNFELGYQRHGFNSYICQSQDSSNRWIKDSLDPVALIQLDDFVLPISISNVLRVGKQKKTQVGLEMGGMLSVTLKANAISDNSYQGTISSDINIINEVEPLRVGYYFMGIVGYGRFNVFISRFFSGSRLFTDEYDGSSVFTAENVTSMGLRISFR